MKLNLKIITLTVILGSLYYFLSHYKNNKTEIKIKQKEQNTIIDKKPSELPAPKVYISHERKNRLGISNNWKSR
jgi:hypothetical protein